MSIAQELRLQANEKGLQECDARLVSLLAELEALREQLEESQRKTLHLKDKSRG